MELRKLTGIIAASQTLSQESKPARPLGFQPALGMLLVAASLATLGCHRQFYRKQADQEVDCLIEEKSSHLARRPTADFDIDLDRRSRMYNPFDLDFQPMPMDDPASHRYMQCVDGRRSYPLWDAAGFTNASENPDWWQFLPLNEDGVLVLNADTAVQLALLHSPDYQRQLEQLYLSALDVSSERFRFDTQFFFRGTNDYFASSSATGNDTTLAGIGGTATMNRAFTTGGQLIADVANSITWQLSGDNTQSATSLLNLTFLQPLLRNAGRDVVMERLTIAERRLLSNVRAFERFRRSFYLNITIGRGTESQVSRSGGVFGVGLQGFTGLGGGFAGLGGGGGAGFTTGAFVPQAGGFVGLLQDQLQIKFTEENITRLDEGLLILENALIELLTTIPDDPEAITRQRLQVAQQRSSLISRRSQLVGQRAAYQASLDGFLQDLGLPPYIFVKIEDPLLDRFILIDEELQERRIELTDLRTNLGQLNVELLDQTVATVDENGLPTSSLERTPKVNNLLNQVDKQLEPLGKLLVQLRDQDMPQVKADIEAFATALPARIRSIEGLRNLSESERQNICTLLNLRDVDESLLETNDLETLPETLREDFAALEKLIDQFIVDSDRINATLLRFREEADVKVEPDAFAADVRDNLILASQDVLTLLGDFVLSLQLIQAQARTESLVLPEIDITPAEAFEIARRNRRDWANARASLVDAWRLIEFNADSLESGLSVRFDGSLGGDGNSPFTFNDDNSSLSATLQWDAPITRLQERNTYRQSLIEFERAKRSYYQFEDSIWALVRGQIRQLQSNRLTFEYGRQSLGIATEQIRINGEVQLLRDARGLNSGPTAARDQIQAINDLLNAQQSLLNVYVNYEVVRRNLDFDLGTMQVTPEGMWIDQGEIDPQYLLSLPGTTVEALPGGGCNRCGTQIRNQPQPPQYSDILVSEPQLIEF
ncbi:MAG: hypothetical protein AAGJ83_00525 [Planctomycetota bacterium]